MRPACIRPAYAGSLQDALALCTRIENQFAEGAFHYYVLGIDGQKYAADVAKWKVK